MSLKQQIDNDIKKAMLAKQKEELEALRSIKSMILLAETDKSASGEISGDAENKILMKAAKQRKESADIFQQQNRQDLAEKELFQLDVISRYLPKQLSEEEIASKVKEIIAQVGAAGPQDMGKVMGAASKALSGQADGKVISELVKRLLTA
ncbi:MAG TPA: GatB/YqeY domain-containing protein [Chryseolinea sp.]